MPCELPMQTAALFALAVVLLATAVAGARRLWPKVQQRLYRIARGMVDY